MAELKKLIIADKEFDSRLFVGTGKFSSNKVMAQAIAASGTQMVTVALRRVDIQNENDDMLAAIDKTKYQLLPNTSGARDADEAVRLSRLARAASGINWVKLEVTPDPYYLLPDGEETLKAAKTLVEDDFIVLPYINADPILAKKLQDAGCATVMPLASPIGSNQGMKTRAAIEIIIEQATVQRIGQFGVTLFLRQLHEADKLVHLGLQFQFQQRDAVVAAGPPGYVVEMAEPLDHLAQLIQQSRFQGFQRLACA